MNDVRYKMKWIFLILESELHFVQPAIFIEDPLLRFFSSQKIQVLEDELENLVNVLETLKCERKMWKMLTKVALSQVQSVSHLKLTSSVKSTMISKNPNPFADELAPPTKLLHQPRDFNSDKIDPEPS